MSKVDYRSTALLTEHFGFPPLALIDDVINAVNDIMYSCTKGIVRYLMERQELHKQSLKATNGDGEALASNDTQFPTDEIESGTAKLETLLESQIDRNFDKFELYTLRNILVLPHDLLEEGWIRLKHHEGVDLESFSPNKKVEYDDKLQKLVQNINFELHLRKILRLQIAKAEKLVKLLRSIKQHVQKIDLQDPSNTSISEDTKSVFKSLSPIDETMYFLFQQVTELISQTQRLIIKVSSTAEKQGIKDIKFVPSLRDKYTDSVSLKILENIGIIPDPGVSEIVSSLHKSLADVEAVRKLNSSINDRRINESRESDKEI